MRSIELILNCTVLALCCRNTKTASQPLNLTFKVLMQHLVMWCVIFSLWTNSGCPWMTRWTFLVKFPLTHNKYISLTGKQPWNWQKTVSAQFNWSFYSGQNNSAAFKCFPADKTDETFISCQVLHKPQIFDLICTGDVLHETGSVRGLEREWELRNSFSKHQIISSRLFFMN